MSAMSAIAKTRTLDPATLSPAEREAFIDALFDVQCEVFAGVNRGELGKYVVDSPAEHTEIEVYEAEDGTLLGYCAAHFFHRTVQGEPLVVMRMEAGLRRACRGAAVASAFVGKQILAHRLRDPTGRLVYLGSLVHPSSYASLVRNFDTVWPHPDRPTPPEVHALLVQLGDDFSIPRIHPDRPLLRQVGWVTRDSEVERDYWQRCRRPTARYFVDTNPGYTEGHGLLTLVMLDNRTFGRSVARWGQTRLRKLAAGLTGAGESPVDHQDDLDVLRGSRELTGLSDDALRWLLAQGTRRTVAPGSTLIHQGDHGDVFYVALQGSAHVFVEHAEPVLVDQTVEGEVFGGMAVLTGQPRSATVKAATKMVVLELHAPDLKALFAVQPAAREVLWTNIARDRFDTLVQSWPRMAHLSRAERAAWFSAGHPLDGPPAAEALVFVVYGRVERLVDGIAELVSAPALLAPGDLRLLDDARVHVVPARPPTGALS